MTACRSCGAEIRWARTRAGKLMPLDAEPNPDGNVEARPAKSYPDHNPLEVVTVHATPPAFLSDRAALYYPHHASCPDGESWKARR